MSKKTVTRVIPESTLRRAREYETIYIMRAKVSPDDAEKVSTRFTDIVGGLGGKIIKFDSWGWRRLAYPIKGETRGVFIHAKYAGYDDVVLELERNLRLLDQVVRFQTILLQPQIDMDDIQVDPAEAKPDPLGESDLGEEITVAQRLGLVERQPQHRGEPYAAEPEKKAAEAPEGDAAAEPEKQAAEGDAAAEPEKQAAEGDAAAEPEKQAAEGDAAAEPEKQAAEGDAAAEPEKQAAEGDAAAEGGDNVAASAQAEQSEGSQDAEPAGDDGKGENPEKKE